MTKKTNLKFRKESYKGKCKVSPVKLLLASAAILCGLAGAGQNLIYAQAAQENEIGQITELSQIMVVEETVDMKAEPDESAATLMTYEKGALAFATGETPDGWYRVSYQDKVG